MKTKLFLFLNCLLLVFPLLSQVTESCLKKGYTVEEVSYGKIPKDLGQSEISPMDLFEAQLHRVHYSIEEIVFADGHHIFQTNFVNAGKIFSNWPVQVSRVISDSTGTCMYDSTDVLWRFFPADSAYNAEYQEAQAGFVENMTSPPSTFPLPGAEYLAYLDSIGYLVELLDQDAIRISNSDEEQFYEPQAMRVSTKNYVYGRLEREYQVRYTNLEGYGVVPLSEREVLYETRPSGLCMEKINVRRYSNYFVEISERMVTTKPEWVSNLKVWPTPVSDALFVQIPRNVLPGSSLRIYNSSGSLMMESHGVQPNASCNFEMKHFPPGVYVLQAELLSGLHSCKVIKQ